MTIDQWVTDNIVFLSIEGDIAMNGTGATPIVDKVRGAIHEGHDQFLIDLGHVRYVDSAGLGELVQAFSVARKRGGSLKLLNVTKRLKDLLVVTRLLTVFDCFDDEATAMASFASVRERAGRGREHAFQR